MSAKFIRLASFFLLPYIKNDPNDSRIDSLFIFSIWPAVLRQATYGTIKFGTYYTLKKVVTEKGWLIDKHGNERVWCNVLCAVTGKQFAFEIECKQKRQK